MSCIVVKVGGSLFDLPDLRSRLESWLDTLPTHKILLVPGGGPFANVVRQMDQVHRLGDQTSHWLALYALSFNAEFLCLLLSTGVVEELERCEDLWREGYVPVVDARHFSLADQGRPGSLPASWDVTSDSIAARVAEVMHAEELVLLKSIVLPEGIDWDAAHQRGIVDAYFPRAVSPSLPVRVVNLRQWSP